MEIVSIIAGCVSIILGFLAIALSVYFFIQSKISEKEVQKMEQKEKGMYLKYLHSEKIGILVTNKPGQQRLKNALRYLKSLKEKKGYIFISNDLNTKEFENFQINCWVNTACPRMDLTDGEIINLEKLQRLEKLNSR